MNAKEVVSMVSSLAGPIATRHGCELWDVEYLKEAGAWFLRVYIDKDGGIFIDDCENVSRELEAVLDEMDPIPGSYTFEVSSAGAERQLRRPSDFQKFMGSPVFLKLYRAKDGAKEFSGVLSGYEDGVSVSIETAGVIRSFAKEEVALVRLRVI